MTLCWMLQPNKNAVISKIKKRRLQLPKSSEKMPLKFRAIRTFFALAGITARHYGILPPSVLDPRGCRPLASSKSMPVILGYSTNFLLPSLVVISDNFQQPGISDV